MSRRSLTLMALVAGFGLALFGMPSLSGATFTSASSNPGSSVTAAADWTPPTVSVTNPGTSVKDTVTIVADALDGQSGIASVTLQHFAPGASTWTTLCTDATSPYSCSWNTKLGADGKYDLRAIATDNVGYTTTSDSVSTTVANNLLIVLGDPGDVVRGTLNLTATLFNSGVLPYSVTIQYAVAGTTTWKPFCTVLLPAYSCSWNTLANGFTQGESYDLRAIATNGASTTTSAIISDVLIDNIAPTVTMTDPGTPLRGTATFAATALDADAGVSQVVLQYQRTGTATWTTFCTLTVDPYSCRYDTAQLVDGTYAFRAIATDGGGLSTTSSTVTNRVVDNTVSAVSMEDPGANLSGTVTLAATASSTAGVTSVRIDRAPSGTTTWTTMCTDTTSPYTCSFDTTAVADGLYDFRAVLVDGAAKTTISTTLSARRIDNSPLRAYDVQTTNGGAKAGKFEAGDTFKLTYTQVLNLGTVTSGWNGSSLGVTLRLRDGGLVGTGSNGDTVDIQRTGNAVNLGSVNLKQNYLKNGKTVLFNANMVATTTTVNGNPATVVTVTLVSVASGTGLRTVSNSSAMVWTPTNLVSDLSARTCSTVPVTELGATDREF